MSPSPDVAEIVKRLRDLGRSYITLSDPQSWELGQILPEAADALDRMKAELDELQRHKDAQLVPQWAVRAGAAQVNELTDLLATAESALAASAKREEALKTALTFYECEAVAIARYMNVANKTDALLASITVLALDQGKRARAALSDGGTS